MRYLVIWRVNSSLVFLPRLFSLDVSRVIGTIIANRLPTRETGQWTKILEQLNGSLEYTQSKRKRRPQPIPDIGWPINSTLFFYPVKRTFGRQELIFWELKLFGEHADHGLFLEVILPAMEEASYTSDPRWNQRNRLWGQFDIHAIYAARGRHWQPVVTNGRLDLQYQANPSQWIDGLHFNQGSKRKFTHLTWITPFDLAEISDDIHKLALLNHLPASKSTTIPSLPVILIALLSRINKLLFKKPHLINDLYDIMSTEEQEKFLAALVSGAKVNLSRHHLNSVSANWPGIRIGGQVFTSIPHDLMPFLEMASIFHLGKYTHWGFGTFIIT